MNKKVGLIFLIAGLLGGGTLINGCSSSSDSPAAGDAGGGGGGGGGGVDSAFSGKLATVTVNSTNKALKTVTHVMAVNASNSPERYISEVGADGGFSLKVKSGKPYVIVFIAQNGTLAGPDMIVGIMKSSNDLDTLPLLNQGNIGLGTVTLSAGTATSSEDAALLASLGITAGEAAHIGKIDDLSLRLANPDIDGNGVIDALEDKKFGLEWHIIADTKLSGSPLKMSDLENQFVNPANLTLSWSNASANAVYLASFDNATYVDGARSVNLLNGGAFSSVGTAISPTGMNQFPFSDKQQWGPWYDLNSAEMAASDAVSTFAYTLGSPSKKLTFSNVRTKTKAELNADGLIMPLLKFNVASGKVTGISYKWVKRSGGVWTDATANEVSLLVLSPGGTLMLYSTNRLVNPNYGISFRIPKTATSGTVNIGDVAGDGEPLSRNEGPHDINTYTLNEFCSSALSYDDSVGLRIFAGSPSANATAVGCN